ncbi:MULTISPECIES: hypothetical protein [Mycobacterium]|uniref:ESX-1 secretion-associated protein EspK n=1 Tax=Mycobacterium pseudoshottsii TaxID=265949 RepID=A0A9N7QN08_9MYCO|nr:MULTISPECIES: hypothetical protein [Mycobacterium]BDN81280.1 ESX-1 secretion-associated protein EspK [Mycobacterium pseudoshottsii]BEH75689.1 ESX-1 secretion-associated protein EspK [Mycobacterium pseudoshottsii]
MSMLRPTGGYFDQLLEPGGWPEIDEDAFYERAQEFTQVLRQVTEVLESCQQRRTQVFDDGVWSGGAADAANGELGTNIGHLMTLQNDLATAITWHKYVAGLVVQAKLAIDTNAEVAHQQILVLQNEPGLTAAERAIAIESLVVATHGANVAVVADTTEQILASRTWTPPRNALEDLLNQRTPPPAAPPQRRDVQTGQPIEQEPAPPAPAQPVPVTPVIVPEAEQSTPGAAEPGWIPPAPAAMSPVGPPMMPSSPAHPVPGSVAGPASPAPAAADGGAQGPVLRAAAARSAPGAGGRGNPPAPAPSQPSEPLREQDKATEHASAGPAGAAAGPRAGAAAPVGQKPSSAPIRPAAATTRAAAKTGPTIGLDATDRTAAVNAGAVMEPLIPVSAARAERDAIAEASTADAARRNGADPLQLARRIAAALNAPGGGGQGDLGFFWVTAVTTDATIVVANSYGLAYIPDGVQLPEPVQMASADEAISATGRACWATRPVRAVQRWAACQGKTLRAVIATEQQFADSDPGVARIVLDPGDIPASGKMTGRPRLQVVNPEAAQWLADTSDAGLTDLLPPASAVDPAHADGRATRATSETMNSEAVAATAERLAATFNLRLPDLGSSVQLAAPPPGDRRPMLWLEVMKPMASNAVDREAAHLRAFLTFAEHAQRFALDQAHSLAEPADSRAAIADWLYWKHLSGLLHAALNPKLAACG